MQAMKIGFDYIATVSKGGNGVYSHNLIETVLNSDRQNKYYLYAYAHDFFLGRLKKHKKQKNVRFRPVYFSTLGIKFLAPAVRLINLASYKFWVKFDKVDIFHFTNPAYFARWAKKTVITIHDLSGLHDSTWTKKESAEFLRKSVKKMIDDSVGIIAVSNYTSYDLAKNFPSSEAKTSVVYEGCAKSYYVDEDRRYIGDKFKLKDYILYVGQLQPRKNIVNMLAAYAKLPAELKGKYNLAIVGGARRNYLETVRQTIDFHKLSPYVKVLGRLPDADIRKLYSTARAFVFLSYFEGFGLPVLEALKCGTPVIVSNRSSLPEVAGNAGVLVGPDNLDEIAVAMEKIMTDENFYGELKSRCQNQAEKFSWKKAAAETQAKYKKVFSQFQK